METPTPDAEKPAAPTPDAAAPATPDTADASSEDAAEGALASESLDSEPATTDATGGAAATPASPAPKQRGGGLKQKLRHINMYFLLFLLVLLIAVMALVIGLQKSKNGATPSEIATQTLSTDDLNKLKGNDVKIGDATQTLSVQSNAVFAGKILVQGGVDVAGSLKVGGTLSLANITVSGTSALASTKVSDLAVSGNAGVQGQLTVQKTINVTGGASFGGPVSIPQLTVESLTLNHDLTFSGHIDAGGASPGRSNGTALGGGGTSSVSGTDTAGTIAISTGSAPAAGCFISVTFATKFNGTPHVVISPTSSDAGDLDYYVTKNTAGFSVCANNPAASKSYQFDYIVID